MSGEAFVVCVAGDTQINHHFHLAVCVQLPVGPAGPEEWCGQQKPSHWYSADRISQGWVLGHGGGTWWWDMDWRKCKILPDLYPQAGRTGLGRCHHIGELTAA